jgi:hypothetical protein
VLEDLILDALKVRLMAPELVTEFIAEYHAEINRQLHAAELDAGFDRRELEEVTRKLAGLIRGHRRQPARAGTAGAPGRAGAAQGGADREDRRRTAPAPGCIPTSPSCIVKRWRNCGRR